MEQDRNAERASRHDTRHIRDDDWVVVDGTAGMVQVEG
jgi:hypothetical protein